MAEQNTPKILSYDYRYTPGGSDRAYGYQVTTDRGPMTFIPQSVIEKGILDGNTQYFFNSFLDKPTLTKLYSDSSLKVDLKDVTDANFTAGTKLTQRLNENDQTSSGILVSPDFASSLAPKTYDITEKTGSVTKGAITGLSEKDGKLIYVGNASGANNARHTIDAQGVSTTVSTPEPRGFFRQFIQTIGSIPLLPEIAGLATGNPYVYAALKGVQGGVAGEDPLKVGLKVGASQFIGGQISNALANVPAVASAADLAGGSADLIPGVMGGGQFAAAGGIPENLLASSLGGGVTDTLNVNALTTPPPAVSYPVAEYPPVAPPEPFVAPPAVSYPVAEYPPVVPPEPFVAPPPAVSPDLYGGSADLVPGVMGGGAFEAAATPYVTPAIDLAAIPPGVQEGMAPGVLAPASPAELAAVGAITAPSAVDLSTIPAGVQEGMAPGVLSPASAAEAAAAATVAGGGATALTLDDAIKFITSPAGSALLNAGANIVGGITSASAAKEAAQTQAAAADRATELQREMYNKFLEMNKPYYEAGVNALGKITRGEVQTEPGYGFRLGEGMKALERLQASRGSLLSGGAIKGGQRYAQDVASGEYGNAYNRLANLAGLGQTASSQAGTMGQNYATAAGNLGLQGANALTQGRIGRTSSYTNALMGVGQALAGYGAQQQQNDYMNRLLDIYGQRVGG
jgi:hypothetical protein